MKKKVSETTTIERLLLIMYVDSMAVKGWREQARAAAVSALSLAGRPEFSVFAARNSKGTLLGLAACGMGDKAIKLHHLATRDAGTGIGSILCDAVVDYAADQSLAVKTVPEPDAVGFYDKLGWRKVGAEYWSK